MSCYLCFLLAVYRNILNGIWYSYRALQLEAAQVWLMQDMYTVHPASCTLL